MHQNGAFKPGFVVSDIIPEYNYRQCKRRWQPYYSLPAGAKPNQID